MAPTWPRARGGFNITGVYIYNKFSTEHVQTSRGTGQQHLASAGGGIQEVYKHILQGPVVSSRCANHICAGASPSSLHMQVPAGQLRLVREVRLARLRAHHIVQPRAVRLESHAPAHVHDREVHPRRSVAHRAHLIADVRARVLRHCLVQLVVRDEVEHVSRDRVVVARCGQVSALSVLNLQRDAAGKARDHRAARMQPLGDLHLEALARGELQCEARIRHQRIQHCSMVLDPLHSTIDKGLTLIAGRAAHDNNVARILLIRRVYERCDGIVDDARIGVVHRAVTADQELWHFVVGDLAGGEAAEACVRVDNVRDALARVETRDLDYVLARGPRKLVHLLLHAQRAELAHVVLRVPRIEVLVQPVEPAHARPPAISMLQITAAEFKAADAPVRRRAEQRELLRRHVAGYELVHGVADEHVRVLDVVPEVAPHLFLRRAFDVHEVTPDLDVRAVDDRHVRADALDERDQPRHLRVVCNGLLRR